MHQSDHVETLRILSMGESRRRRPSRVETNPPATLQCAAVGNLIHSLRPSALRKQAVCIFSTRPRSEKRAGGFLVLVTYRAMIGGQSGLRANCSQAARRLPVETIKRSISRAAAIGSRIFSNGER